MRSRCQHGRVLARVHFRVVDFRLLAVLQGGEQRGEASSAVTQIRVLMSLTRALPS